MLRASTTQFEDEVMDALLGPEDDDADEQAADDEAEAEPQEDGE